MHPSPSRERPRHRAVHLGFLLAALLVAGCANNQYPTTPPDPRDPNLTWAQKHYLKKMQYQQWTTDRLP